MSLKEEQKFKFAPGDLVAYETNLSEVFVLLNQSKLFCLFCLKDNFFVGFDQEFGTLLNCYDHSIFVIVK